jgi:ectoine hydroxylase-related dioxygenase (phytanoyl-CoA dioxygenase family)
VFDGNVIHGAAINKTDKIRFSVDFRMIAKERLCSSGKADSTVQFAAFTIT